jgi:hypothetical protein
MVWSDSSATTHTDNIQAFRVAPSEQVLLYANVLTVGSRYDL